VPIIDLYHYARSEDLDSISEEGIKPGSKYFMFDVPSRNSAAYLWRFPDEDVMGYDENPRYVLLRAKVDAAKVKIAPMDLISAAYVNYIGRGQPKNPEIAAKLIAAYEKLQVPYFEYETGRFRTPEALVEGGVDADDIAVIKQPESLGRDDATAYLETYMILETGEFYTIEKED
jgi:hypothetical protein